MSAVFIRRLALCIVLALGAGLIAVFVLAPALGFRWDPFDRLARRAEALEVRLESAEAVAVVAGRQAQAQGEQAQRLDAHHTTVAAAHRTADRTTMQAQEAEDADIPLSPDRAARLRNGDRRLCELVPDLCVAAAADAAQRGDDAVPSADPA